MKGYFFNAEPTMDLDKHPTGYDREYDADSHAAFFEPLFGPVGVLLAEGQEEPCKVEVVNNNLLRVRAGAGYVKGRMVVFDGSETIAAKAGYVVTRMNKSMAVRDFQLLIVDAPVQEEGDVYDLPLARVTYQGDGAVHVEDSRVFLTAKVLGGHRHKAEDVDGLSNHTHSAESINSGVLAVERVPYQVDSERIAAKIMGAGFNDELAEKFKIYTFSFPFDRALEKTPKCVHLVITHGLNDGEDPDDIEAEDTGGTLTFDLMVSKDGAHVEGYVDGTFGSASSNAKEPFYTNIRRYYRNLDAGELSYAGAPIKFPLRFHCSKASASREAFWSGHGGAAFFSYQEGLTVHIGGIKISKNGVSLKMCRSSDASQYYSFTASGYVFN